MSKVPAKIIFKCNYNNLQEVIDLANKFGPGHTVYKLHSRPNYNIRHTSRMSEIIEQYTIHHQT